MSRSTALAVTAIGAVALVAAIVALAVVVAHGQDRHARESDYPRRPIVYKASAGPLFVVESDLRHVAAIDLDGEEGPEVLWCRDPVLQLAFTPNAGRTPRINSIGPPAGWMIDHLRAKGKDGAFVAIGYSSGQFGVMSVKLGEYTQLGVD